MARSSGFTHDPVTSAAAAVPAGPARPPSQVPQSSSPARGGHCTPDLSVPALLQSNSEYSAPPACLGWVPQRTALPPGPGRVGPNPRLALRKLPVCSEHLLPHHQVLLSMPRAPLCPAAPATYPFALSPFSVPKLASLLSLASWLCSQPGSSPHLRWLVAKAWFQEGSGSPEGQGWGCFSRGE